jgi:hypothetical protein
METTDFGMIAGQWSSTDCRQFVDLSMFGPWLPGVKVMHASDSALPLYYHHHLLICGMAPISWPRLVGRPLLYSISAFASLGVFLFGYDQGVMSGIITGPHFRNYFNSPTPIEVGTMVAVLEVGAFITSIAAGQIGDIIGRRGTLFAGAVVFAIGGAVQTLTTGFYVMVVGRVISGLGVGLLSWVFVFLI